MLVTGGLGYIGSHTVKEYFTYIGSNKDTNNYANRKNQVIILDNLSNSNISVLDKLKTLCVNGKNREEKDNIIFYNIDCRENLEEIFEQHKIETIIHFAALKSVGESVSSPLEYYDNNINSLINLLKYCSKYKVKKFIFSSSCSLYGDVKSLPVNEDTPINIDMITSPYAFTKLVCERILKDYITSHKKEENRDTEIVILRYFNPVGADESGLLGDTGISNVMPIITRAARDPHFVMRVYGNDYSTRDGTCIRDYIHVTDLARAHILAIDYSYSSSKENKISYFNLGSETGITVLELIRAYEKYNNVEVKYVFDRRREGDIPAIYSDSSKAKMLLGWAPQKTIRDIVVSAHHFSV